MPAYIGILFAIIGGALAQLLMKAGLRSVTLNDFHSVVYSIQTQPIASLYIFIGIVTYVAAMVVWVYTLKNHELNKAYPLLSLGYVVVYLAAVAWPGIEEALSLNKTIGISLIIFGVWYSQQTPVEPADS